MIPTQEPGTFLEWQGRTLAGRYQIETLLRHDSLTAVYKATDPDLQRPVTVQIFNPDLASGPHFQAAFTRWSTAVAQLRHPHIAQVYDFGQEGDTYYLVSEYRPGITLAERLKKLQAENRRPDVATLVRISRSVGAALDYAHRRGLVHGTLHPGNVILDERGEPVLTAFGLARVMAELPTSVPSSGLSYDAVVDYLSPEQVKGEAIDGRSDLYALGVILYEMAAGERPFQAATPLQVALMHVTEPAPDVRQVRSDVPLNVAHAVEQALAKDPNRRFQAAAEMVKALAVAADEAIVKAPVDVELATTGAATRSIDKSAAEPVKSLRLDVAAPDRVEIGRAFDLAVAVRQLDSPKISEADLRQVKSGFLRINWPRSRRAVRLRLEVSAPDCRLHGKESYAFRLYRGQDSPVFYFHLTAEKAGDVSIIVTVYQEEDWLGSARLHTTAYEQVAGRVAVNVTSQVLRPDLQMPAQLRQKVAEHFNLDELRSLCFDLGIDYENFPATKEGMTREIVMYCQRHGQISLLLEHCRRLRPEVSWQLS